MRSATCFRSTRATAASSSACNRESRIILERVATLLVATLFFGGNLSSTRGLRDKKCVRDYRHSFRVGISSCGESPPTRGPLPISLGGKRPRPSYRSVLPQRVDVGVGHSACSSTTRRPPSRAELREAAFNRFLANYPFRYFRKKPVEHSGHLMGSDIYNCWARGPLSSED